jgi:hypothetical protein
MKPSDAVVGFDGATALGAFGVTVAFNPMMGHHLRRFFRLDVSADAGSGSPLNAPLVHRILANCHHILFIIFSGEKSKQKLSRYPS